MASLYGRLFRYRERPHRRPKEDFLTEALADLLARMPRPIMAEFTASLFLPQEARREWQKLIDQGGRFDWRTHYSIQIENGRRYPDLVLVSDADEPLLLIENKIGHQISEYPTSANQDPASDRTDEDQGEIANQLTAYGQWLALRSQGRSWPGAIALLTHFTPPPADFAASETRRYGLRFRHICRWHQLFQHLTALSNSQPAQEWSLIGQELAEFLREEEMNSETITFNDIARAEVFMPSAERFENTFSQIWETLAPSWKSRTGHSFGIQYLSEHGIVWDWMYLKEPFAPAKTSWYVAWGIRFPEITDKWKNAAPPLPQRTHVFVSIGSEGKPRLPNLSQKMLASSKFPKGWSGLPDASDEDIRLVIAKPLAECADDPNLLHHELTHRIRDGGGFGVAEVS
jgi:hypothetical protein